MLFELLLHPFSNLGLLVGVCEIGRRGRDGSLVLFIDLTLVDCGDGCQEIGSISTVRVNESEVFEIGSSFTSRTIVNDPTFGNDGHFVVEVVDPVTGLVKTDDRGVVFDIGEGSEYLVELESGIGVKTSSSVIPELDG